MPTTLESQKTYHFLAKLSAGKVDPAAGTITGATVAKAGVQAIGKFIFADADGNFTRDPKLGKTKIPVYTDEKTLDTLMGAAQDAGARVKCREDHDDSIKSRIGYCFNFQRTAKDTVSTDIKIFDKFSSRDLLFETATQTPELIGLSIDPGELQFERGEIDGQTIALMRVTELNAVDIVDAGAITPSGLLLSATSVDKQNEVTESKTQSSDQMASPTLDDLLASINKMTEGYAALAKQVADQGAALSKMAAPAVDADKDGMKAQLKEISDALKATTTSIAQMKKERALLGFRATATAGELAAASNLQTAEDIEKMAAGKKDYLTMVADRAATDKCSRAEAHNRVQKTDEGSAAYAVHLMGKGVANTDQMKKAGKIAA